MCKCTFRNQDDFFCVLYYVSKTLSIIKLSKLRLMAINQHKELLIKLSINPSRPDPGRREKINLKFLFSHFFVVPRKGL